MEGRGGKGEIMQQGSIRGHYIIHSGKSISGEYSGVNIRICHTV